LVFLDETGLMLQPLVRRTWAPRGQTPWLDCWDRHDRWSVIGALTVAPWARRLNFYFEFFDHNIQTEDVLAFLRRLHRQLRRPLIVVLDRWSVHRKAVGLLEQQRTDWLRPEWLPSYAPELNPTEHVWNHTKWGDLANFVAEDKQHLRRAVHLSFLDQHNDPNRLDACFRAAELCL
jgi:putative transposase